MSDFKYDSLLALNANTGYAGLASASVRRILYEKPDGITTGYWDASSYSGTVITYNVQNGDIDQSGDWKLQAYIEVGGLQKKGNEYIHNFDKGIST